MHLLKRNIRWNGARYVWQTRASGMKRLRELATHPSIFNPAMDWINWIFLVYANATKLFLFGGLSDDIFHVYKEWEKGLFLGAITFCIAQKSVQIVSLLLLRLNILI